MNEVKKQVVITRTFPANIERLWKAFTTAEDMLLWQSPEGMITPHVDVDLQVGGEYSITMEYMDTGDQVTVRGVFKVIEKPSKLVYTWKWDGSDEDTEVTFLFSAKSDMETMVTLIHAGFSLKSTEDDVKNHRTHQDHESGWTTAFDKLELLY